MKLRITIDGKAYEVEVELAEGEQEAFADGYLPPRSNGNASVATAPVAVLAPPFAGSNFGADKDKVCRSPIAGVIVRVDCEVGQQLKAGDPMLVLEAMKMETNIVAPTAGRVKEIAVKPADAVQLGQPLVELE